MQVSLPLVSFRSKVSTCLLVTDPRSQHAVRLPHKLPGMHYSANEQCQILFGTNATFCRNMEVSGRGSAGSGRRILGLLEIAALHTPHTHSHTHSHAWTSHTCTLMGTCTGTPLESCMCTHLPAGIGSFTGGCFRVTTDTNGLMFFLIPKYFFHF